MIIANHIKVIGKVQGVWYRKSTLDKAKQLGIVGFVQNESDGSVFIEAEGEETSIKELISWCQNGPEMAIVKEVITHSTSPKGFSEFEIK